MNTREIKFRAWDKKYNTWFNGNVFDLMSQVADIKSDDEFIYQQYTGLKDKNNKEIYEGDICKVWGHPQLQQKFEWDAVVIWEEFSAGFHFQKILPTQVIWDMGHNTCEIIGNIYEHKHLLEEKTKTA
jgi:uncharacterized phage protein (TIGR01671 family)